MKRLLSLCLVVIMLLSMTGCEEKGLSEGSIQEGFCYDITGIPLDATVMVVNGIEVPMDMYVNLLSSACIEFQQFMYSYGLPLDWEFEFSDGTTPVALMTERALGDAKYYAQV